MRAIGWVGAVLAAFALAACGPAHPSDPERVVVAIYAAAKEKGGIAATPWSDDMKKLLAQADAIQSHGELIIDVDPVLDAQDGEAEGVKTKIESGPANGAAVVAASFSLLGQPRTVRFDLIQENGAWKVDDVRTSESDFRKHLRAGIAAAGVGMACTEKVGAAEANKLVARCLQVSPATRPPCNADNDCGLIKEEIARGCAQLKGEKPPFCAAT